MALCTAVTSVYAGSALDEALEYLSAVGIDYEYDAETILPDQQVTKAAFIQNVAELLNMSDIKCKNSYYHDVSSDHWAYDSVGILTELGIIKGNGNKYFYPDKYITRDEAATIIVSALGYGVYADNFGGYPSGYIKVANELELFKNCTSGNQMLTLSNSIIMLRNTLDANIAKVKVAGKNYEYEQSEDTVLSYYHEIYYGKGVLTGCDGISFEANSNLEEGKALIDGVEYNTELTDILNDIGTRVEFLYTEDEFDNDERNLIWINSLESNQTVELSKGPYDYFDSDKYIYYYRNENNKEKRVNISEGVIVIYNGALTNKKIGDILGRDKFDVRFVKSKSGAEYDIAIVWQYQNMVAGKVDLNEEVIYDKLNLGKMLDISDDREKIIIGGGATLEQIEEGDILSYYESEDKKLLKIEISKNSLDATAKWIRDDDGVKSLITADNEYPFYDYGTTVTVLFNEKVKIYFDKNGYIAGIDKLKSEGIPAYLIKAKYKDYDESLTLTTLDYDGNIVQRTAVEKARLDGLRTELDVIYSMLTVDKETKQQVVILKLNENGEITDIDTTAVGDNETKNTTLRNEVVNYTGQYKHHGRLVPKYLISQSSIIFSVPSVASDDMNDYVIKSKSDMSNDQFYTFDIYGYSPEPTGFEEILVIKDKNWGISSGAENRLYVLIDKITKVVNEFGEAVEQATFARKGNITSANTVSEFSLLDLGVKSGDLVQFELNMRGEIKNAVIKYSYGSSDRPLNTAYNAEPGLRVVYAHEKFDRVLRIGHKNPEDFDEVFEVNESDIIVYDPHGEEKIRRGTMWDIRTFAEVGNSCTTVAIQTIDEGIQSMIIYK